MADSCVTDAGYISAATDAALVIVAQGVLDLAITEALTNAQKKARGALADMQAELAERQIALAEAAHAHASAFWPEETDFVNDAFGQSVFTPDRVPMAAGWGQFAIEANTNARAEWLKASRAMCMPPTRCDDARWSFQISKNVVDTTNHAMRQAELRADALNDRRYSRQYSALGLGQGKLQSAKGFAEVAGIAGKSAGGMLADTINSGLQLVGYAVTRNNFQKWNSTTIPREYLPQQTGVGNAVRVNTGLSQNNPDYLGDFISTLDSRNRAFTPAIETHDLPPVRYSGRGGYE